MTRLQRVLARDVERASVAVTAETLGTVQQIVDDVRRSGDVGVTRWARWLGDADGGHEPLHRESLEAARDAIDRETRDLLERTAERVRSFANAQRASLQELTVDIPGGRAGHRLVPIAAAGCYAPGGRYPLPSSVLMTVVPARVAGVDRVVVASPKPTELTIAAAAIAGADALVPIGGAQAVAALAYGTESIEPCDLIVGPGNAWVTAAKKLVSGDVAIDMLAGPSELVVLADDSADPRVVAADLIAQAEHDPVARPILVTTSQSIADAVDAQLERQLASLSTAPVASVALSNSFAVVVDDRESAADVCNRLAPEHLEVIVSEPDAWTPLLTHYGALFVGTESAEVFGDYGAGPNHVLPTGGGGRFTGGLSVFTFLRVATWMQLDDASPYRADAAALARLEGLEGHARAAEVR